MKAAFQHLVRLLFLSLLLAPGLSFAGFSIQSGQLVDNNGVPFVMRGINYPYTWYQSRPTQQDFVAMAATGANTVRIVLSTGGQWARVPGAQVSQLIQWAKDNRMIAVLEVHDSTGWSEQTTAVPISNAVAPVAVTSNVGWTAADNQTWLGVAPAAGTSNGSFTVSPTANTGTAARSGIVTVSGGGISRPIAVTQAGQSSPVGSVAATGVVTSSSGWLTEEQLRLSNTANITALSITITVQRTTGVSASGQYNTIGGTIAQSNSSTASAITYLFSLSSGQTLTPGTNRTFAVQMNGNGTVHPTSGDKYTVTGTAGGQAFTLSGTF